MASSRVSGARLDQLLQHAAEPAFWLNRELKLVWVNRAWEELTGCPAAEAVGLVCQAHGPTRAGDLESLAGSFFPPAETLAGHPVGTRTLILHPSGERRWRRVNYWPFHNEKGDVTALLGLVREADEPSVLPESDSHRLRAELMELRHRLVVARRPEALIGRGPAHGRLLGQIEAAAASDVPVLIVGESGTGKRHVATLIHQRSQRRNGSFLPIDVQALPSEVLERELFRPASFENDGTTPTRNRLAAAEGATLMIRDVFDLPRELQDRLAHALDGSVRLIASSTIDPRSARACDHVQADLYYGLTALVIEVDPLRARLDELPLLAQHFLERANRRGLRHQRGGFSPEALRVLLGYDWPGNLRELARVVEEAQAIGESDLIETEDLPAAIRGNLASAYSPPSLPSTVTPLDEILTQVERRLIENALAKARHNKSKAAELLGISRPRLYRRIKELGLPEEPDSADELSAEVDGKG